MKQPRVACIGVGVIGSSWAVTFARGGCEVKLYDSAPAALERGLATIDAMLGRLSEGGASVRDCRARIQATPSLEAAVAGVDFVQESAREDLAIKRTVFAALDAHAPPSAVLASSTSEIPAARFTESLRGRARCLVAHPLNPPHLVPLVELCPSPWTTAATVATARRFFESVGQEPIVIHKELPGFVANRMQVAVIVEALRLVAEGYCSAEDVDRAMRRGLGMRWTLMGPLETNRLAHPDGYAEFIKEYWPTLHSIASTLEPGYQPPADIGERIERALAENLHGVSAADQAAWRDRSLIRLRALLDELGRPVTSVSSGDQR
jgi:L-gulonate 3-dehydrogenase